MSAGENETIQLANVEAELNKHWRAVDGTNKTRACLFNLIIYTSHLERANHFKEMVRAIIDKSPCRIFFIKNLEEERNLLKTSTSLVGSTGADTGVVCDEILIEVSGTYLKQVPLLVLPYLLPDLPVYLLWGDDPTTDGGILTELLRYSSRVIFDSDSCKYLNTFCHQVHQLLLARDIEVVDVNWGRIKNWRDVFCQIFNTADKIKRLSATRKLIIRYNAGEMGSLNGMPQARAIYLQAWLAVNLGWSLVSSSLLEDKTSVTYVKEGLEVLVELCPIFERSLPLGLIQNIDIQTNDLHHYLLTRSSDFRSVNVELSSSQQCEIPFQLILSSMEREAALMREIFFELPGDHYEKMLAVVEKMDTKSCSPILGRKKSTPTTRAGI